MALKIPARNLDDKFKLADFQDDYTELLNLFYSAMAQPTTVNIVSRDEMRFVYDNGITRIFRFVKSTNGQIVKIINLTDNKETIINNY